MNRIDELIEEVKSLRKEVQELRVNQSYPNINWQYNPSYTTYRPPQFPCEAGSMNNRDKSGIRDALDDRWYCNSAMW